MYALLLYADAAAAATTTPEEAMAELAAYDALTDELADLGVLRGGEAFLPAADGIVVSVEDDETVVAHVEVTASELSGFYVVACDEQLAVEIAARMPVAEHGHVEVRPVLELASADPRNDGRRE